MLFMKGTPDQPQCGFSGKIVGLLKQEGIKNIKIISYIYIQEHEIVVTR